MTNTDNPFDYPLNPDFGHGIFRRGVRLINRSESETYGEMEDCNHGFAITVQHDGKVVTKVDAKPLRVPFNTCPQAANSLQALVGKSIGSQNQAALMAELDWSQNCTHWLDLALLTLAHAGRKETERLYTVAIPDEEDEPTQAKVYCNGEVLLDWQIHNWEVLSPAEFQGNTLYRGFSKWAGAIEAEDQREAAFVLQKGYFVSRARRFDLAKMAGEEASNHTIMVGACFTYSEPQIQEARRTAGTTRDFTDTEVDLLKFI